MLQLKPVGRRSRKVGRYMVRGEECLSFSLLKGLIYERENFMGRKWHGAQKTSPLYSPFVSPAKFPTFPTPALISRVSTDLGIAMILSTVVLLGEKQLLLWEGTKMQADACASQLLPCAVNAGSTASAGEQARPKAKARETGHGSPELGPCTGQHSRALVELKQTP